MKDDINRPIDFARLRLEKTNVNARFSGACGTIRIQRRVVELATSINRAGGRVRGRAVLKQQKDAAKIAAENHERQR
jgi:hypothetical protein